MRVILIHGFLGRNAQLNALGDVLRGIGHEVIMPSLPPVFDLDEGVRATDSVLRDNSVNTVVIGFSMGGLIATRLNFPAARIMTVCTPHAGTSAAGLLDDKSDSFWKLGSFFLNAYSWGAGDDANFNSFKKIIDVLKTPGGLPCTRDAYVSCVASKCFLYDHNRMLRPIATHVFDAEGDNDGLVSVDSALSLDCDETITVKGCHLDITKGLPIKDYIISFCSNK